ncbi:hypothetical protein [Paractinoplanes durhamensis]|uniref:hypothetical protein n=1 Tax=Paractinoplanes durhamensis TaxID=113563 RepID=UPI00363CD766
MDLPRADPAPPVAEFWPTTGPRHATDDLPPAPVIKRPDRRPRLILAGSVVLALLMVGGGVLARHITERNAASATATSPDDATGSPVPTGPAVIAPEPSVTTSSAPPSSAPAAPPPTTVAPKLPANGTFDVAASSGSVTVRSQKLGTDLYRVTLGKTTGKVTAKVADSGTNHRLTLVKAASTAAPAITITLNSGVRWSLKLSAGNYDTTANLANSKLAALELAGGAHVFTLTPPPASGTLPLRITHGMNQLKIKTNGVPVRMTLRVGAGRVVLDGVIRNDTTPGRSSTQPAGRTPTTGSTSTRSRASAP